MLLPRDDTSRGGVRTAQIPERWSAENRSPSTTTHTPAVRKGVPRACQRGWHAGARGGSAAGIGYAAHLILMSARSFGPRPAEGLNYPNVMQMFLARVNKTPELTALRFKRDGQ